MNPIKIMLLASAIFTVGKSSSLPVNYLNEGDEVVNNEAECPELDKFGKVSVLNSEQNFSTNVGKFDFKSSVSIDNITVSGDTALRVSNFNSLGTSFSCYLSGFLDLTKAVIYFYHQEELVDSCVIYFAEDINGNFHSSSLSLDTARRAANQDLGYGFANDESNDNRQRIPKDASLNSTNSIGATGSVSGILKWKDDEDGIHPLIGAKVKITIDGSWWSGETYTNETGFYSFSYSGIWYAGSGHAKVHVLAENDSVNVKTSGTYEKVHDFGNSAGGTFSYTFSPKTDGDMGKAIMMFQGAKNFADYAEFLNGGTPIGFCHFVYPDRSASSGANYKNSNIYIAEESPKKEGYPSSYASWDMIGHEYGHHIENVYGFSQSSGGEHVIVDNNIDARISSGSSYAEAKEKGKKLAWAEGWATYWSIIAQYHFNNDLKNIKTVGDSLYTASNGVNYNLDDYEFYNNKTGFIKQPLGDGSEFVVQSILYKLYSPGKDSYDHFSIGEMPIWNLIVSKKPVTFAEFVNYLYEAGYNKNKLGIILGKYEVITDQMSIKDNEYFDKNPVLSWNTTMGSEYLKYNQFDLYFEKNDGTYISKVNSITASGDTATYVISPGLWNNIKKNCKTTFIVYFVARQTDFESENYYSQKFEFDCKPFMISNNLKA